jgi:hypothetical protein
LYYFIVTGLLSDTFGGIEVAGFMTFLTGILCFALWIPAKSFGVLTFFSISSGSILGIYWPVSILIQDSNQTVPD